MEKLQVCLPSYETKVLSFEESKENDGFRANLRVNIETKDQALAWLAEFSKKSLTSYRVEKTYPENTQKIVFKKKFHCIHNTKPSYHGIKTPHAKHTACNAKITIKIKQKTMKRSKDMYLKKYPTEIVIQNIHNHLINSDSLRHRPPTKEVKEIFTNLFLRGHSPSTAFELFKLDLEQKHKQHYDMAVLDGSICPTKKWCYDLYYKLFKKPYNDSTMPEMINLLNQFVLEYNENVDDVCAAFNADADNIVLAVCTPLMKRIHQNIKSSSEIVFIDSFGCMGRTNSRVLLLLCASEIGTLPLGAIVTYFESEDLIFKGLELLKMTLPGYSFCGQCSPKIFITDDNTLQRNSIKRAFPESTLLLCECLVLQSFVKFLWSSVNCVDFADREYMYTSFSRLLHIKDKTDFETEYNEILSNETFRKYKKVINYLKKMRVRSNEWAISERMHLFSKITNFRMVRDKILNCTRAYNILQMFDFLTINYEEYYKKKISDVLNNTYDGYSRCRYTIREDKIDEKIRDITCEHIMDNLYRVISKKNEYIVNSDLDTCTCPFGSQGASCKHQFAVVQKFGLTSIIFIPILDSNSTEILKKILIEDNTQSWYRNRKLPSISSVMCKKGNETLDCWYDTLQGNNTIARIEEVSSIKCKTENIGTKLSSLQSEIDVFCESIKREIIQSPSVFFPAVETFLKNCTDLKNTSLVSAFNTFGKS